MSSFQAPVFDKSDPKANEPPIIPFHTPRHWPETSDSFASIGTALGGFAMIAKQPMFAWVAIIAALLGVMNSKPLTEKKDKNGAGGSTSAWGAFGMGVAGVIGSYLPRIMIPAHQLDAAAAAQRPPGL